MDNPIKESVYDSDKKKEEPPPGVVKKKKKSDIFLDVKSNQQNKEIDKMSDIDIKEEGASDEEVGKEAITKADTNGDESKSGGIGAAAINTNDASDEDEIESKSEGPELDKMPMNERRRSLIKVRIILQQTIRDKFSVEFSNRCGHWLDRHMTHLVCKYGYWLEYPDGHHVLKGHSHPIQAAAVSTDGRFLFTADRGGMIIVWDLLDHSMLKQFNASDRMIHCLIYERDLLVCAGRDKKIHIFNGITHDLIRILEAHGHTVFSIQFNKKNTKIVSTSRDKSVKIWCVQTGDCLATLNGHSDTVYSAYFMDNDTKIMSGSEDGSMKVWRVADQSECDFIGDGIKDVIYNMSVNCDSSLVACCLIKNGITNGFAVYNWPNMDVLRSIEVNGFECQFHPSNRNILAVADNESRSAKIYNVRSGDRMAEWKGHSDWITGLCWSRDGCLLVSVCNDRTTRVWNCTGLI